MHVHSFPPEVDPSCRVLILGSMPGKVSLRAGEYYAHPRNLFWRFMEELFEIDPSAPYARRVARLRDCGVGLWDVLKSCTRETSLDSDIVPSSIVPNDFARLFRECPRVRTVCFNGTKAASAFGRHVLPGLHDLDGIAFLPLPSTSPANASIPLARKLSDWRVVAEAAAPPASPAARPAETAPTQKP